MSTTDVIAIIGAISAGIVAIIVACKRKNNNKKGD